MRTAFRVGRLLVCCGLPVRRVGGRGGGRRVRLVRALLRLELLALRSHRACDAANTRVQAARECERVNELELVNECVVAAALRCAGGVCA